MHLQTMPPSSKLFILAYMLYNYMLIYIYIFIKTNVFIKITYNLNLKNN